MNNYFQKIIALILFIFFISCTREQITFETPFLKVGISGKGIVTSFFDRERSVEYLPKKQSSPLLGLYKDSVYIHPVSAEYKPEEKIIVLKYPNGSQAVIKAEIKNGYLRFELISLEPRNGIEAVVWGPYPTSINEKIGETICVVRNQDFAFGLQALNINTIEGLPDGDDNGGGGGVIEPLQGQELPDSLKDKIGQRADVNVNITGDMPDYIRMYRGSAAVRKTYGSELRLFSRDRRIARVIKNWLGNSDYTQYAEPIDVDFAGTAIAMFGCPEPKTLDIIENIELGEGLPHPMLDGVWIKRSTFPGEAYLLNEGDPLQSIKYAKACGFRLIHIGDIFSSWGHFGYSEKRFPGGLKDIVKVTEAAGKEGISMGVHTLGMFTGKNDPYVTPVPSDSLCKTGSTVLTNDAGAEDDVIYIRDPVYFRYPGTTHTAKIGKELVNYRKVSDDEPWRLIDCQRGQYGTVIAEHISGTVIDKLTNDSYSGFYPDIKLQDAYAKRLAEVCNETSIDLMDFDGFGGESPTGHGTYGAARFIDTWYKNIDRYRLTCGAGTFHYYWHIYAFMNWGEPWYNALRESQVNYRIENQRYFERNLMPGMLGWFTLNPEFRPEEVEWIQARSAAFNAGYLLRVDESIENNGYRDQLFEAIREWQEARRSGSFTPEQKERMKDPKNEFHLERTGNRSWNLYPVKLSRGFEHKFRDVQTGEPVSSKFMVNNPFEEQPLQFYVSAIPTGNDMSSTVSRIHFKINNYQTMDLNVALKSGDRLLCDGNKVYLCDRTWNKLKVIYDGKIPIVENGDSEIAVTSNFAGSESPKLQIEFKSTGKPDKVEKLGERGTSSTGILENCPFVQSDDFSGLEFGPGFKNYLQEMITSDTWYPSWASDGNLYSPWTDGKVRDLQSNSAGKDATTGIATLTGDDPKNLTIINEALYKSDPYPYESRYPCGSLVYDGIWYYGTYCLYGGQVIKKGKITYNWPWMGPFVGFRWSADFGRTWTETPCTPENPLFSERTSNGEPVKIGAPHFVDFGKNSEYSPDGKAYLVAHGASNNKDRRFGYDSWITGDEIYIVRVTPGIENMNDASKYEFWNGQAWTNDFSQIKPIAAWTDNMGCVTMTYNAPLKKYLMCVTDGGTTGGYFNTYILESTEITGPWKMVQYFKHFGEQAYFVNIPSKFISKDGSNFWLCYSANFASDWDGQKIRSLPEGSSYSLCLKEVKMIAKNK